jgi:hypothetical protein
MMETYQQTEVPQPQKKLIVCIECRKPYDAKNLFVDDSMHELVEIKREDEKIGDKSALILTPEELCDYAVCVQCRWPEENTTLALAMANFEAEQLVSCYSCAVAGKETLIPRRRARAPGWVGCNILKGQRLQFDDSQMQNPHRNRRLYVDSKELLNPGSKDGFALCSNCSGGEVAALKQLGYQYRVPKDIIFRKIRVQMVTDMLDGVRMAEERHSRNR